MSRNIVLIGLSGCGKSTVGAALSYRLRMHFVDMDAYIEHREGKTISEIFKTRGEAYFRQTETQTARILSTSGGKIIATGGGVVLNPENMAYLKQNAVVVFLDRTPEEILKKINLAKRPLLAQNKNRLFELDRQRRPLYEQYADIIVPGASRISLTVDRLQDALQPYMHAPAHRSRPAGRRRRPSPHS